MQKSSRYVIARLIGDRECLACGAEDGPLIEKWSAAITNGHCLICGAAHSMQEAVVPPVAVDAARLARAEARLATARQALETAAEDARTKVEQLDAVQVELDELVRKRAELEKRVRQIAGSLPPSSAALKALEGRVKAQTESTRADFGRTRSKQKKNSRGSLVGSVPLLNKRRTLSASVSDRKISQFLVERAEISLTYSRAYRRER